MRKHWGEAIVIGAGFAGLLAARVLGTRFARVTILDRDRLPTESAARRGTPQSAHAHALLSGGHGVIERLLPGLTTSMRRRGVEVVDWGRDFAVLARSGWMPASPLGLATLACGRDLLEWTIRQRVLREPGIHLRDGCSVRGLMHDDRRGRVVGVRWTDAQGRTVEQRTDLVVDASGRNSHAPRWLEQLGYGRPAETTVVSHRAYASRFFQRPPEHRAPWKALLLSTWTPDNPRGGVLYPMENDRWQVTLVGADGERPPVDEEGFRRYARDQRSDALHRALEGATPITPIRGWRRTENRFRHFDRMKRWPAGFVVLGDAVCALNPVFAQGMTASAVGAAAFAGWLADSSSLDTRRFQRRVGWVLERPFFLALCEDLRWSRTSGAPQTLRTRLVQWYLDAVSTAAADHVRVHRAHMSVWHMQSSFACLFNPSVALPALRAALVPK